MLLVIKIILLEECSTDIAAKLLLIITWFLLVAAATNILLLFVVTAHYLSADIDIQVLLLVVALAFIDVAGMRPQCLEQATTYIKKQLLNKFNHCQLSPTDSLQTAPFALIYTSSFVKPPLATVNLCTSLVATSGSCCQLLLL